MQKRGGNIFKEHREFFELRKTLHKVLTTFFICTPFMTETQKGILVLRQPRSSDAGTGACRTQVHITRSSNSGQPLQEPVGCLWAGTSWDLLFWWSREYWKCTKGLYFGFGAAIRCSHFRNFWNITWSIWDSHLRLDRGMILSEWSLSWTPYFAGTSLSRTSFWECVVMTRRMKTRLFWYQGSKIGRPGAP